MNLKTPDARIYGYLAWGRYSSVVPNGMYQMLNPAVDGIGTGPFKLDGKYVPNSGITLVRNPNFWKKGLPYLDSIHVQDHHRRAVARRCAPRRRHSRRNGLGRQRRGAEGRERPEGAQRPQRLVP